MATWRSATGQAVTTERQVRVINDAGEEGYVSVSWENRHHMPRFFGPVMRLERVYDAAGAEIAPPRASVLDENPTFA